MIFNKKFEDITFEDIQALKDNQVAESEFLDYKSEFKTEEAAKLVSAFANTYGGFIVYGVETEEKSNIPKRIVGINEKRLEDRLDSICYDKISPPVFCQSKYVEDSERGLSVFLVKVPESDLTPHGIENNTQWYVKVKGQKRPYARVDFDRLEWLRERRRKHIEFRIKLVENAIQRSDEVLGFSLHPERYDIETIMVPRYPRAPLIPYSEILQFLRNFRGNFDIGRIRDSVNVHEGIWYQGSRGKNKYCVEINCYGLYYNRVNDAMKYDNATRTIPLHSVVRNLTINLYTGMEILEGLGFHGSVRITCAVRGLRDTELRCHFGNGNFSELLNQRCQKEDELTRDGNWHSGDYRRNIKEYVTDFLDRLLYAYGVDDKALGYKDKSLAECIYSTFWESEVVTSKK